MLKKKITLAGMILSACMIMCPTPVMAATATYNWTFHSTSSSLPANSGLKNDTEQNYYLTINAGNISASNVFGTRIRRSADDAFMSNYVLHRGRETSAKYGYSQTADMSTLYYMKGKKDTSSTTTTALNVSGRITY